MSITIKDVAKEANVGIGTVSRVINGEKLVKKETRERVLEVIDKLNYVPSSMGKRLRTHQTNTIAVFVPVITDLFFAKLVQEIEIEADKKGYSILLVASQQRRTKEQEIISKVKKREVDGAIIVTHFPHDESEFVDCNIVSIDRHLASFVPYITSNNYGDTKKVIEYLIGKGCKKIGYIGSKAIVESEVSNRIKAYEDVMNENSLPLYELNEVIDHGQEKEIVKDFFTKYQNLDGLFISGYSISQEVYHYLTEKGIKIPEQIQLVAYDENFTDWIVSSPNITCIKQDIKSIAKKSIEILIDKINGEKVPLQTIVSSTFVIGKTTK